MFLYPFLYSYISWADSEEKKRKVLVTWEVELAAEEEEAEEEETGVL